MTRNPLRHKRFRYDFFEKSKNESRKLLSHNAFQKTDQSENEFTKALVPQWIWSEVYV